MRRFLNEQTISSEQLILKDHKGTVSIEGRTITNLHFADDVDGLAGEEETLANLVERLNKAPQPTAWRSVPRRPSWWQHQCYQHRDQSEWTEGWNSHKFQIPGLNYNWWGFQALDTLQDSTDNSSIVKAETSLDRQEYFSQLQDTTDVLPCHIHLPVCLWIMVPHSRAPKKSTSYGNEVLPQDTLHLIQRPCYQRGSLCQDPAGNWATRRPLDDRNETQTAVVWSCLPFIRSGQNHPARHNERGKKTRQTEEEVGRQHQRMDRPWDRQVPEGSGEQGKMEKTGCKIICGAPTTLVVKGLMMMMMILFCGRTQEPMLATVNTGKNCERFWKKYRWMDPKVKISKEEIPGSKHSMYGYILTYFRL